MSGPTPLLDLFKRGEVVDAGSIDAGSAARIEEHMRL